MNKFLFKYKMAISLILSLIESILLGIFLSLIAENLNNNQSLFESINNVKGSYIYIILTILCFGLHIYVESSNKNKHNLRNQTLINEILKSACDAFIYPDKSRHIRAIVTMCDYKNNIRKTIYGYNINASPERVATYDLYFGVTGEAVKRRIPVAQSLESNHIETYEDREKSMVEPRLQCVLAAPIFSQTDKEKVIGVLAFDSMETIDTVRFDTDYSKELAQSWADILSAIIED